MHATSPWYAPYNTINIDDLEDIAKHHQNQIENNQRILTTKEQQADMAKQQHDQAVCLHKQKERLNQLVEMISSQDAKLNRLKALRNLVQQHSSVNFKLSNELNSIQSTIDSKDEELRKALDQVDNLNRQLLNFRKTRPPRHSKFSPNANGTQINSNINNIKQTQLNSASASCTPPFKFQAANNNNKLGGDIPAIHKHVSSSNNNNSQKHHPQADTCNNTDIRNENDAITTNVDQTTNGDNRHEDETKEHKNSNDHPPKVNGSVSENQNGHDYVSDDQEENSELSSPTLKENNSILSSIATNNQNVNNIGASGYDQDEIYPQFDVNIAQIDEANNKNTSTKTTPSKDTNSNNTGIVRRVSFDPLALLLDAALEGELELVKCTSEELADISAQNDEGVTALHNAVMAGHIDVVRFLVKSGCDVNVQDDNGWTPLHCSAQRQDPTLSQYLVENGALIFATNHNDQTAAHIEFEDDDEEELSESIKYLLYVQENIGVMNGGKVYALFDYEAQNSDELSFENGELLIVLRKEDTAEQEWWWARKTTSASDQRNPPKEGYVPRNLVGLYPRAPQPRKEGPIRQSDGGALNNSC